MKIFSVVVVFILASHLRLLKTRLQQRQDLSFWRRQRKVKYVNNNENYIN